MQARDYDTVLDIVNAYKTLKQAVGKPSTIHGPNTFDGNKGYLKMTIAATQHSKSKVAKDILEYSMAVSKTKIYHQSFRIKSSCDDSWERNKGIDEWGIFFRFKWHLKATFEETNLEKV